MDQKEIHDLIKLLNKTDISEFRLKEKDFSIVIRTNQFNASSGERTVYVNSPEIVATPVSTNTTSAPIANINTEVKEEANTPSNSETVDVSKLYVFKSPMVGTFYRKPSPDKPVFAKVDDKVTPGTVLCVIEAMKLFNEIECEISGTIVKVLVDDSTPVEYDQPLFLINPA